jgi:predicted permease
MGANLGTWLFVEGKSRPGEPAPDVEYRAATPEYFATMGIPLRAGRLFDAHDEGNAGGVLLINETAARRFWPGESAVGKRVKLGMAPDRQPWITIIGVVGDVRHSALDARPLAEVYRLYAYNPMYSPILVVRTQGDPAPLVSELAARVRSVSSESPAYNVYVMEALVERSAAQRKFVMWLLAGFAVAALLLAGVGIYGTVSQALTHRTQEIGLRMALGASPGEALALVFGQGMRLMLVGVLAGAVAAAGLAQLMRNLLFEVQPLDPMAFCGAAVVLGGFAALACYIPAHRATRVDPLIALRNDG